MERGTAGTDQVIDEWDVSATRARCELLRNTLRARGVPPSVIDAHWPVDEQSLGQWVRCFANCTAELRIVEARRSERDAELHAAIAASLDEEPHPITLSVPEATHVYPKSFHTLSFLESLDAALREMRAIANGLETAEGREVIARLEVDALEPLLRSQAARTWVWVLTSPGCALPFDDELATLPDPPEWTKQLTPEDLLAVFRGHIAVHRTRLAIIANAFPAETETDTRLSLAGFLGTTADHLGKKSRTLMRKWTLGLVFAQAATAAQASREAHDAATARRPRGAA